MWGDLGVVMGDLDGFGPGQQVRMLSNEATGGGVLFFLKDFSLYKSKQIYSYQRKKWKRDNSHLG